MAVIKNFLTQETVLIFGFHISTFILTALIILLIYMAVLKMKNLPIVKNLINCTFISLSIITFLFAFLNALTGEFLFSQQENIQLYMFIAMVALFMYIVDITKGLFEKEKNKKRSIKNRKGEKDG